MDPQLSSTQNPHPFFPALPPSISNKIFKFRILPLSAHFHKPTIKRTRINHLRKKLFHQGLTPPTINHPSNPIPAPNNPPDNHILPSHSTRDDDYDGDASSVLWNQLEAWANHHKVRLNQHEIFLPTTPFEPSLNEVDNAKHKISHAKHKLIPPNTSFVNSCGNSGFHAAIQTLTASFPKLSKLGISVFCVVLVFLAFNSFSRKDKGDDKKDYSSLEGEMLRRKLKARMLKDKSIKAPSSVEAIQDEPELVFKEKRPSLDKQVLMNNIAKEVNTSNDYDTSLDFYGKIRDIRVMARSVREKDGKTSNGEDDDDKEVNHIEPKCFDFPQGDASRVVSGLTSQEKGEIEVLRSDIASIDQSVEEDKRSSLLDTERLGSVGSKLKIISSVKEAREYLHRKGKKLVKEKKGQALEVDNSHEVPDRVSNDMLFESAGNSSNKSQKDTNLEDNGNVLMMNTNSEDASVKGSDAKSEEELGRAKREKWMEDNFHEFEPLVEKIRGGFRNSYMVAREKVKEDVNLVSELKMLERDENESEFEWMKDEKLREIVFQVRENELMGRDPFYLMDTQDKALFFKGLEKKVERENEKLRDLHEYLHANIENLDYGADGISLYDPPEKIIPRWKGPPPPAATTILDDYLDQRKALFAETLGNLGPQNSLQSSNEKVESKNLERSKTMIEGSDGYIRPGKKSGKEFWQHTKKWSRGFIDSYNAENDPETKAAMKDIGKDLDRWITEKEIQDAAAAADRVMDKVPDKGKKLIAEKINKLKSEMEMFGPQAVVSKYSEYGDEEETDYYWWLDLPFLLCIELYIDGDGDGDGDERIGFYSLEMASDLELDPKPHHIIAFEDAGDCKNLCYIIQAHMEMLGNGNAFVVPQLPKDTYKEAKANGFNVTVIRKGELKLDVDQTLEEVEEKVVEIGSKMYHDQIMKSRNVDVGSVMKGVFGLKNPPTKRRRWKKKLKKATE